jgi:hypothetical protein
MTGEQLIIIIGGAILLGIPLIALMMQANRNERETIDRRRAEWLASGGRPEDEPNFFSGSGDLWLADQPPDRDRHLCALPLASVNGFTPATPYRTVLSTTRMWPSPTPGQRSSRTPDFLSDG